MSNKLNIELTDKYIILSKKYYKGETPIDRMFKCEDGFGCSSYTIGQAIFGHFTVDGKKSRVEGYQIERLATEEEVKQANHP